MMSFAQSMKLYDMIYKFKHYWEENKFSYTYIYNCFSGANGNKIYFISCAIAIGILIATHILLQFLNSIATCMITVGFIFLLIHIDVVIKSDKLPWTRKFDDPKYTHLKKGILEPLKNIRTNIYEKIGISTEGQPKLKGFYIMFIGGIVMIVILALVPVELFMLVIVGALCTVPQAIRHHFKKDIEKHDMVKEMVDQELKEKNMYVSKKEVYDMKKSMKPDPNTLKKYGEAKRFKKQFKKDLEESHLDVGELLKSRVQMTENGEKKEMTPEEEEKQKEITERMKKIMTTSLTTSQRSHNLDKLREQGTKQGKSDALGKLASKFANASSSGQFTPNFNAKRINLDKLNAFDNKHNSALMKEKPFVKDEKEANENNQQSNDSTTGSDKPKSE